MAKGRGWHGESKRHSTAAMVGHARRKLPIRHGGPDPKAEFERGDIRRAVRDVLARKLQDKHRHYFGQPGIVSPYALATSMVQKGAKLRGYDDLDAVATEFEEQSAAAGKPISRREAMKAAGAWVKEPW